MLYSHEGTIRHVENIDEDGHAIIHYDVDATEGQSGAPLQLLSDKSVSCGVHGGFDYNFNVGTLITRPIYENFVIPTLMKYVNIVTEAVEAKIEIN